MLNHAVLFFATDSRGLGKFLQLSYFTLPQSPYSVALYLTLRGKFILLLELMSFRAMYQHR